MSKDGLIPFNQMSPEKHRELSSRGGKKSAENRRIEKERKSRNKLIMDMMNADLPTRNKSALRKAYGDAVDDNETYLAMMVGGMIKAANKGNVSAFQALMEFSDTGELPNDTEDDGLSKSLEELGKQL